MYSVNVPKLEGRIKEKGFNYSSFALALGITRETLRSYLNDYTKMPYRIINLMAVVLDCTKEEAVAIFFCS